jgi:O-antigen/teichoic acid export membrane protein
MEESKVKKSVVLSGLVSTGGLFVSKLIGLLYTIPFSYILSNDAFTSMYGSAYRIYSYFLNVFTAGFPFAISTLVAKYSVLNDAKTVLEIKRIALRFLSILGAVGMLVFAILSPFIAPVMMKNEQYVSTMRNVLLILSIALFLVPVLSAYRGVVQGRKEMTEYAFSQTFEQLFRVGFLLSAAFLTVYVLKMDRVWALYAAVASTSVAAMAGLWQIIRFDRKHMKQIVEEAGIQTLPAVDIKLLYKEFFAIALPYMGVAVLGYSDDIFNAVLLPIGLNLHKYTATQIDTITSTINFAGTKLTAIPMILAPGFSAALIPHMSEALEVKNYKLVRKNIMECLNIIVFIGLPVSFCIFAYATPICATLFYTDDLSMAASVTRWIAIEGFLGALAPVITNMMMALRLRKSVIRKLIIYTLIKGLSFVPLVMGFGFAGAVLSSLFGAIYLISSCLLEMKREYAISLKRMAQNAIGTIFCTLCLGIVCFALSHMGLGVYSSKMVTFLAMAANGLISVLVFAGVSLLLNIPQALFHFNLDDLVQKYFH